MKVLLLGEASFRYSLALVRSRLLPPDSAITASSFGRIAAADLEANVAELQKEVRVLFDVGANLPLSRVSFRRSPMRQMRRICRASKSLSTGSSFSFPLPIKRAAST